MTLKPALCVLLCAVSAVTVLAARRQMGGEESHSHAGVDELRRVRHGDFGYDGHNGPDHWPSLFPECGGRSQSPVDLPLSQAQHIQFPTPLVVPKFEWNPSEAKIFNNGHTVQLMPVYPSSVKHNVLYGGPLTGEYEFVQLHFHWGENDYVGSEHAVDGQYYAMEMHMVFQRKTSRHHQKSLSASDDIVVVAAFLKLYVWDNQSLAAIVRHMPQVEEVNAEVPLHDFVYTAGLLPSHTCGYLFYNGSLTTPPCSESVTWIVYCCPIGVSSHQVAAFRRLKSPTGRLTWNRRPVQPLNGRNVYYKATTDHGAHFCPLE